MEIHGLRPVGPKDFTADIVARLPSKPTANVLYVLTAVDGEFNPGLYVHAAGDWLCTSRIVVSDVLPDSSPFESICLLTAEYSTAGVTYMPGFYRRDDKSEWIRAQSFGMSNVLPAKCNVGDWYFVVPGGPAAPGRYDCFTKNIWTHAASSALKASGGLLFDPGAGLYLATDVTQYDRSFFAAGKPAANTVYGAIVIIRPCVVDLSRSLIRCATSPSAARTHVVRKNGSQIATLSFSTNSKSGALGGYTAAEVALSVGDTLEVVSAAADSALAGIFGTFWARLTKLNA